MTPEALAKLIKAFPVKELGTGNIRTCPVRLSYANLFKPIQGTDDNGQPSGDPKYSVALLFPVGANISLLSEAAKHAAIEKFGPKAASLRLKMPIRDQIEKADRDGNLPTGYAEGAAFFNCTSKQKPGIVDAFGAPITDESKVYSGQWALVTVRPFGFENRSKGVAFGLQNVQIIADDERLGGGRAAAADEFEPLDGSLLPDFNAGGDSAGATTAWD